MKKRFFFSVFLFLILFIFNTRSFSASTTTFSSVVISQIADSVVMSQIADSVVILQIADSVLTPDIISIAPPEKDSLINEKETAFKEVEELADRKLKLIDTLGPLKEHNEKLKSELNEKARNFFISYSEFHFQQQKSEATSEPVFIPVLLDTVLLNANPLFIDLVYMGVDIDIDWKMPKGDELFLEEDSHTLYDPLILADVTTPVEILADLRRSTLKNLTRNNLDFYKLTFNELPSLSWNTNEILKGNREKVFFDDPGEAFVLPSKIEFRVRDFSNWNLKVNTLLQFSQISVSDNWHKGGDSYLTVLGIVSSRMDYDNRKSMRWENSLELRTGLNTVAQDSLRSIMPSDDLFKGYSKLGVKAGRKLYYSSSLEFQTQFFDNPKKINSRELKAKFLTPIRLNIGIGVDYKPTKFLSVAVSPLSYKVIYLADTTRNIKYPKATINPNAFGIKDGRNLLHEFGSKLVVVLKEYTPLSDLKINTRFSLYTNYEKVEIDWEVVAEYTLNRFLSTRLMLNPRFDNTAILKNDEKARLQLKQMLTIGVSYRLY